MMKGHDFLRLRNILVERRGELLERVRSLEDGWEALGERETELEEQAQKAGISEPYDLLDGRGKEEIEQIDLALSKMVLNDYGICESCGDDIDLKRLEAIPWARLCIDCAWDYESKGRVLPETAEAIDSATLPDELQGLTGKQLERMIYERLASEDFVEADELKISVRKGVLYLEGAIPGEKEHQVLLRILKEEMGFGAIVDRLTGDNVVWEKERRTSGKPPEEDEEGERLTHDGDEISEDVFEAEEEDLPYTAPDTPPPHMR